MRNRFIDKVTRVHKTVTVANSTNLCSTILVVFLEFILIDRAEISFPYEHSTEFVPVTEPARLPGSYEEALSMQKVYRVLQNINISNLDVPSLGYPPALNSPVPIYTAGWREAP